MRLVCCCQAQLHCRASMWPVCAVARHGSTTVPPCGVCAPRKLGGMARGCIFALPAVFGSRGMDNYVWLRILLPQKERARGLACPPVRAFMCSCVVPPVCFYTPPASHRCRAGRRVGAACLFPCSASFTPLPRREEGLCACLFPCPARFTPLPRREEGLCARLFPCSSSFSTLLRREEGLCRPSVSMLRQLHTPAAQGGRFVPPVCFHALPASHPCRAGRRVCAARLFPCTRQLHTVAAQGRGYRHPDPGTY